ncbi:Zinc finger C2H2 superfamily [Sesbania bispinosa]|nr:Zinc finger C2H2 superfamily [Sesbania bispinosa]
MEQHKNGKRHKKNMKAHEELQRRNVINGQQSEQLSTSQLNLADQPKNVQKSEKKECPTENLGSEITANNHKDVIELQNNVGETSEVPAEEPGGKTTDNSAARGRGLKRKMRGGKASKFMKTNDGSRPVQLSKPEQAISFKCELCNVKCESNVVYQSHLNGKKHLSRLKRGPGHQTSSRVDHQALSGVSGLQALYPPDINALANAINTQVQQGDNDPQLLLAQLLMNVLSQAQVPAISPQSAPLTGQIPAPTSVAGSSYGPPVVADTSVRNRSTR